MRIVLSEYGATPVLAQFKREKRGGKRGIGCVDAYFQNRIPFLVSGVLLLLFVGPFVSFM